MATLTIYLRAKLAQPAATTLYDVPPLLLAAIAALPLLHVAAASAHGLHGLAIGAGQW
jgi:hypothetical protein